MDLRRPRTARHPIREGPISIGQVPDVLEVEALRQEIRGDETRNLTATLTATAVVLRPTAGRRWTKIG